MTEHTTFHRHGLAIHIETVQDDKVIDHSCIAVVNEYRPAADEYADYIVLACNSYKDLLTACQATTNIVGISDIAIARAKCNAAIEKAKPQ